MKKNVATEEDKRQMRIAGVTRAYEQERDPEVKLTLLKFIRQEKDKQPMEV